MENRSGCRKIHGKNNKRNFVSIWHAPQCAANHVVLAQGQIKHSPDLSPSACTVLPSVSHLHNPNEYGRLVVFHTPKSSATCTVSFAYCGCSCALIPGLLPCRAKNFYQHRCFWKQDLCTIRMDHDTPSPSSSAHLPWCPPQTLLRSFCLSFAVKFLPVRWADAHIHA